MPNAGETDALVRQTRGMMRLLTDPKQDRSRRTLYFAVIADNFERLDRMLSAGAPLPEMWRGNINASPAKDGDASQPEPETAGCQESSSQKGIA